MENTARREPNKDRGSKPPMFKRFIPNEPRESAWGRLWSPRIFEQPIFANNSASDTRHPSHVTKSNWSAALFLSQAFGVGGYPAVPRCHERGERRLTAAGSQPQTCFHGRLGLLVNHAPVFSLGASILRYQHRAAGYRLPRC